ncbi:uncharacterized protein MYCFIDRAFT_180585 [Pseudocercospora fijiensis CIRAD86]|uniref:Uncharacterized protein n=1 Tax=Pseudocercospora fijiensis (strain CIRAD86) TaxID=383855 RepID=M3AHE8_PSEFD|nr:uncharacterized protein MYCFIDRAFT_180585 [Pseudocercospora fijiensis CIRAD86]EME76927.1 hypothetical protein MYCFIDRAFT_180585 [Pseudocercospora fijiensis CIRAD86]
MTQFWQILSFIQFVITVVHSLPQTPPPEFARSICYPITTCTPEWFLQNTKPEYAQTLVNRALFYSMGGGEAARAWSCGRQKFFVGYSGSLVWYLYISGPKWMYQKNDTRLQFVYSTEALTAQYYQAMSTAFARMARGAATSLHMPEDFDNPPLGGIFGRQEMPALGRFTDVGKGSSLTRCSKLWKIKLPPGSQGVFPTDSSIDFAMAEAKTYNGPMMYQPAATNLVQREMWWTENLLSLPRKAEPGFVDNGNFEVESCPYFTEVIIVTGDCHWQYLLGLAVCNSWLSSRCIAKTISLSKRHVVQPVSEGNRSWKSRTG